MESARPFRLGKGRSQHAKAVAEAVAVAEEDLARAVEEEDDDEDQSAVAECPYLPEEDEPSQPMLHPMFVVQELVQHFSSFMSEFEERFYNADVKKQIDAKAISQLARRWLVSSVVVLRAAKQLQHPRVFTRKRVPRVVRSIRPGSDTSRADWQKFLKQASTATGIRNSPPNIKRGMPLSRPQAASEWNN